MSETVEGTRKAQRSHTYQSIILQTGSIQSRSLIENQDKPFKNCKFNGNNNSSERNSPLSFAYTNKSGIFNTNSNSQYKKFQNKQMFNSNLFQFQQKFMPGKLQLMARQVKGQNQPYNDKNLQKQKNKFSFLQVPQPNMIKPKNSQPSSDNLKRSFLVPQRKLIKAPSFLKKDGKSQVDPDENYIDQSSRKPEKSDSNSIKLRTQLYSTKSQIQFFNEHKPKKFLQTFSPLQLKKVSISPINSSSSYKDKSTNEPSNESPSIPIQSRRKGSMIIESEKDFLTPTQKNNHKYGSSNFIEVPTKHHTAKNSNKSQFSLLHQQNKGKQSLTSRTQDQKDKSSIPSFIKFRQKRNQILKKSMIENQNDSEKQSFFSYSQEKIWSLEDFEEKQRLGRGAFGQVYLVRQKITGFFCVLKKLSKKKIRESNLQQQMLRQIKIQAYLGHKHLTSLYGFFDDESYIYLILEYMSDGSLAQKYNKKKCSQKLVSSYIKQICEGLRFMHIEDIIHRDIKPENVFVHEDYVKIGDFGCSVCSNTKRNTVVGCLAYISPEQLNQQSYDDKIDIWSVGILCYELLTGRSPFEEDIIKIARQQKQAKLSELRFPTTLQLSDEAKDFTRKLLQEIPDDRMTIIEALKHPFITKYNTTENSQKLQNQGKKQLQIEQIAVKRAQKKQKIKQLVPCFCEP